MPNIDLTGANGSLAYDASNLVSGTNAPLTANVVIVRGRIFRPTGTTTRPGAYVARKTVGEWNGGGVLRVVATDDSTPPLITSTQGFLKVQINGTSQYYTVPVVLTAMGSLGYTSLQGETPTFIDYEWTVSSRVVTNDTAGNITRA